MNEEKILGENGRFPVRKTVKDSVFRDLFQDTKYVLQLYQTLHPEDIVTEEDISHVTVDNMFLDQMYNDLGFVVKGKLLVMVEAQASWSYNILVRILFYLAETWNRHVTDTNQNRYGSKKLSLPEPEFYVVYVGEGKNRGEWISLSEEFFGGNHRFLELNVRVLYGNDGDDIISQYVNFTRVYTEQVRQYGRTKEAVLHTLAICKDRNVLKEYLEKRTKEVVDIMMSLFDEEVAWKAYAYELREEGKEEGREQGRAEGREEGREEGRLKQARETSLSLAKMGMSVDKIAEIVRVGTMTVQGWLSGNTPPNASIS